MEAAAELQLCSSGPTSREMGKRAKRVRARSGIRCALASLTCRRVPQIECQRHYIKPQAKLEGELHLKLLALRYGISVQL